VTREERLARAFVDLADTLVRDFEILDFLDLLCQRCEVLDVSATGVLLADKDQELRLVAASSEAMRVLEVFEVQNDEGPCLEAYRSGEQVVATDLSEASSRWPRFAPKAMEEGFRAAFGFPLRLRTDRIGALNLFCTTASDLEPADVRAAQALADIAAIGILQERALTEAHALSEQLQHALHSRVIIEQAKGIVASQLGVDMGEAFDRLRRHSRQRNVPLRDVAAATIDGELPPQDLSGPAEG
jgi:GAF domain-containing protein